MTIERRVRRRSGYLALIAWGLAVAACGEPGATFQIAARSYPAEPDVQYKLPKVLREVSGLTLDGEDRLYAVNDEEGVVYEIDYREGRVLRRFGLSGNISADFEGIAVAGDALYLVDSSGVIYETRIGEPESFVPFTAHRQTTACEVEGLAEWPGAGALLVACKNLPDDEKGLRIHLWDVGTRRYREDSLFVPGDRLKEFLRANGRSKGKKVQPTAIAVSPSGTLVVLAGRQHLLLELTAEGELKTLASLDSDFHRQAEGLAITADGRLIISDEGDNKGSNKSRGRLSIYEPAG
jgi:uncharacterized protein YjiK